MQRFGTSAASFETISQRSENAIVHPPEICAQRIELRARHMTIVPQSSQLVADVTSKDLGFPSMRGQPRGTGVSAMSFRSVERPVVPDSVITGSAGNTRGGATVTVSGGARG